jgi:DNA-binding NtrC family response regulator
MEKRVTGISPEAMELLTSYDWPGNVREFSNAIERAMVIVDTPLVQAEHLSLSKPRVNGHTANHSLAEVEKRHISAVLESTGGNVTQAAAILEVDRVTVYNKIKKYGLRKQ